MSKPPLAPAEVTGSARLEEVWRVLPRQDRAKAPVHIVASPLLAPSAAEIARLEGVAALEGVVRVVALPDLHVKPHLETPSSTATATLDAVILGLSSPSPGCGMALALTSLDADDLNPAALDRFFAALSARLPLDTQGRPPLLPDIRPALLQGAAGVIEALGLPPQVLGHIERRGDAVRELAPQAEPGEVLSALPRGFLPLAGSEFGILGGGNHFLELQVVAEVLDEALAQQWGLQAGQAAVMYHADSGRFGALVGRWYAFRRKNTWRGRWLEMRHKTVFHLKQSRSLGDAYRRGSAYFAPRSHTALPAGSVEARQALLALGAASNYAYANRAAVLVALRDSLGEAWGPAGPSLDLLYDVTHNSIRREQVGEEMLWVHRHNASLALPAGHPGLVGTPFATSGQPLLLPGTSRTSSYLCVALPGVAESLFSVDHGAGRAASRMGKELPGQGPATRLYTYKQGFTASQPHLSDDGIDEVLRTLVQAGLARPVARLRPVAVLKEGPRGKTLPGREGLP